MRGQGNDSGGDATTRPTELVGVLAVDLGTDAVKAVLLEAGSLDPRPLPIGPGRELGIEPAVFYVPRGSGGLLVGHEARNAMMNDPAGGIDDLHRRLGAVSILRNGRTVTPLQLLTSLFRHLADLAAGAVSGLPLQSLAIPVPPAFGAPERAVLTEAAGEAGFQDVVLVPDACASARVWADRTRDSGAEAMVVLDCGARVVRWTCVRPDGRTMEGYVVDPAFPPGELAGVGGESVEALLLERLDQHLEDDAGAALALRGEIDNVLQELRAAKEGTAPDPALPGITLAGRSVRPSTDSIADAAQVGLVAPLVERLAPFLTSVRDGLGRACRLRLLVVGGAQGTPGLLDRLVRLDPDMEVVPSGDPLFAAVKGAAIVAGRPHALALLEREALAGVPHAALEYGKALIGINRTEAIRHLEVARSAGLPEAIRLLGEQVLVDSPDRGRALFREAAVITRDAEAARRMSELEPAEAERWLRVAADQNDAEAALRMAERRWWRADARRWLHRACSLRHVDEDRIARIDGRIRSFRRLVRRSLVGIAVAIPSVLVLFEVHREGRLYDNAMIAYRDEMRGAQALAAIREYDSHAGMSWPIELALWPFRDLSVRRAEVIEGFRSAASRAVHRGSNILDNFEREFAWPPSDKTINGLQDLLASLRPYREPPLAGAPLLELLGLVAPLNMEEIYSKASVLVARSEALLKAGAEAAVAQELSIASNRRMAGSERQDRPGLERARGDASRLAEVSTALVKTSTTIDRLPSKNLYDTLVKTVVSTKSEFDHWIRRYATAVACAEAEAVIAASDPAPETNRITADLESALPDATCPNSGRPARHVLAYHLLLQDTNALLAGGEFAEAKAMVAHRWTPAFADRSEHFAIWIKNKLNAAAVTMLAGAPPTIDSVATFTAAKTVLARFDKMNAEFGLPTGWLGRDQATRVEGLSCAVNATTKALQNNVTIERMEFSGMGGKYSDDDDVKYWCDQNTNNSRGIMISIGQNDRLIVTSNLFNSVGPRLIDKRYFSCAGLQTGRWDRAFPIMKGTYEIRVEETESRFWRDSLPLSTITFGNNEIIALSNGKSVTSSLPYGYSVKFQGEQSRCQGP